MKSHLDLIENTNFENDHCHSIACVVKHTAHGKLPDQLNVNISAKSKPVQQHHYCVLKTVSWQLPGRWEGNKLVQFFPTWCLAHFPILALIQRLVIIWKGRLHFLEKDQTENATLGCLPSHLLCNQHVSSISSLAEIRAHCCQFKW